MGADRGYIKATNGSAAYRQRWPNEFGLDGSGAEAHAFLIAGVAEEGSRVASQSSTGVRAEAVNQHFAGADPCDVRPRHVPALPTDARTLVAQLRRAVAETTAAQAKNSVLQSVTFTKNAGSFGLVRTAEA